MDKEAKNCILYFVGASSNNQGNTRMVISDDQREIFKKAVDLAFPCSNDQAEYETLAIGLDLAKEMKISKLEICGDSNLIIKQVSGDFAVKEPNMTKYRE